MKFNELQKAFFNATEGAWSSVTSTEAKDGQVTATTSDGEKEIILGMIPKHLIPRTADQEGKIDTRVLQRSGKIECVDLRIAFPKATGEELRVYAGKNESGLYFEVGDAWFVYKSCDGNLVVGSMPQYTWENIGTTDSLEEAFELPRQEEKDGDRVRYRSKTGQEIVRNPSLINEALGNADWQCEYSGRRDASFISARTGNTYLEGHHLIPLACQSMFGEQTLDTPENLVVLNPLWHRAIHYGVKEIKLEIVSALYDRRFTVSSRFGVKKDDLFKLYGCV